MSSDGYTGRRVKQETPPAQKSRSRLASQPAAEEPAAQAVRPKTTTGQPQTAPRKKVGTDSTITAERRPASEPAAAPARKKTGTGRTDIRPSGSGPRSAKPHADPARKKSGQRPASGRYPEHRDPSAVPPTPPHHPPRKKKRRRRRRRSPLPVLFLILLCLVILIIVLLVRGKSAKNDADVSDVPAASAAQDESEDAEETAAEGEEPAAVPEETETEETVIEFLPYCTEETDPSNLITSTDIMVDDTILTDTSEYTPRSEITFDSGDSYTEAEGIITFRGNNYRDDPTYGYANLTRYTVEEVWSKTIGALDYEGTSWSGCGWTGQPLIVKWPDDIKQQMNLYSWAKEDSDLVEVIYATMDGNVYFLDLETGNATRDPLYLGYTFKGAGALDPRGYPIMYLGSGYDSTLGKSHVFVINLLDCSIMYEFGAQDSYSLRGNLSYFDSSALVDAETDTLIYPGENGILYLMHLNTEYDREQGTLSIDPDNIVKWRYMGTRTSSESYWLGMEDSAVIFQGYLFIADNGGNLMCLDLNTLELVWVQDVLDDTNGSPVLSIEDGHPYIYISTSFHLGWRSSTTATIPIWKIDAENGTVVWQTEYECYSQTGVSGGVQSTIALGKNDLSDYIYVTVSRTGSASGGVLACLRKDNGGIAWEHSAAYAWSSPVCVYNSDGSGSVIYCSSSGKFYLLNGLTGDVYDSISISDAAVEASPAVYENMVVMGTREGRIKGIKLS